MNKLVTSLPIVLTATLTMAGPITVVQTTGPSALAAALGGAGMTITSVSVVNGAASQFGTYSNFTSAPVTIGDGVVLSTGQVVQLTPGFNNGIQGSGTTPSTNTGEPGTAEFNSYGTGRIANFSSSNDVAALLVDFTLSSPSQVGFDFVFGSVEYPQFTSQYTDAFLAFLNGTAAANQIVFDASNNPVQVGMTFAGALTTADTNTAFGSPHGLLKLQTFTLSPLAAGNHSLLFQIGDVNDHILDSAVFISNLRAQAGQGGTTPVDAPEPASVALTALGLGLATMAARRRK